MRAAITEIAGKLAGLDHAQVDSGWLSRFGRKLRKPEPANRPG